MSNKLCIPNAERLLHAFDYLRYLSDVHVVSNCPGDQSSRSHRGQIFAFNAIFKERSPSIRFIRYSSSLLLTCRTSKVFAAGQSLFHFATNAYDIMIKCVFTCLDIALQHIFNFLLRQHHLQPPDELFEHGNHSSAIESMLSYLPNTKDDNDQ